MLVGQILPVFSLLAPCDPGASAPEYVSVIVKRSTKALGALFVACVGFAVPAWGQDAHERDNLTDLREVNVVVGDLDPDAEAAGLDRRDLEAAIERQLEDRGVPLGSSRSGGDLYVKIDTFRGSTGLYAYCVEVSVQQLVTIEGNQLRTLADIWEVASLGTVGTANLPEIARVVEEIVDLFADDYLEINE